MVSCATYILFVKRLAASCRGPLCSGIPSLRDALRCGVLVPCPWAPFLCGDAYLQDRGRCSQQITQQHHPHAPEWGRANWDGPRLSWCSLRHGCCRGWGPPGCRGPCLPCNSSDIGDGNWLQQRRPVHGVSFPVSSWSVCPIWPHLAPLQRLLGCGATHAVDGQYVGGAWGRGLAVWSAGGNMGCCNRAPTRPAAVAGGAAAAGRATACDAVVGGALLVVGDVLLVLPCDVPTRTLLQRCYARLCHPSPVCTHGCCMACVQLHRVHPNSWSCCCCWLLVHRARMANGDTLWCMCRGGNGWTLLVPVAGWTHQPVTQ